MKYRCLRNCFVNDRYFKEGEVYKLPDSMEKHPKNFELIAEATESKSEPLTEEPNPLVCPKCGKECKNKIGLIGHMKSHKEK